jgi:hypothetical protein
LDKERAFEHFVPIRWTRPVLGRLKATPAYTFTYQAAPGLLVSHLEYRVERIFELDDHADGGDQQQHDADHRRPFAVTVHSKR